jgi:pimeloyl-ACP methyl ester carboxylesterase
VLADQLAPGIRFVALDLRGHGFSDKPSVGYDLEHHVSDILQLVEALRLQNPIILGHSAGGTIATFVAGQTSVGGLILLDGMVGDRAFMENAVAQSAPLAEVLDKRYASFDIYVEQMRARRATWTHDVSNEAVRLLERWAHYDLAPLPDGSYRLRALRHAVEAEWASLVKADSLGMLARVSCPILIVQRLRPWFGGRPYFTDGTIAAQMQAAPQAELFLAERSNHSDLVRDPEPAMIQKIQQFVQRCVPR